MSAFFRVLAFLVLGFTIAAPVVAAEFPANPQRLDPYKNYRMRRLGARHGGDGAARTVKITVKIGPEIEPWPNRVSGLAVTG